MRGLALFSLFFACTQTATPETSDRTRIVFKHGKLFSSSAAIQDLIGTFERENPSIEVDDEELPSNTDEQHRFFVINLEGASSDFDVFALDVIWVSEFSRAGWIRPLDHLLTPAERADFFPGTLDAVSYGDHVNTIPWFVGAGVLYYRTDLVPEPPTTWAQMATAAERALAAHTGPDPLYGFVWQGKQYEGLICDALEHMWSEGGRVVENGHAVVDSPANRRALAFMRGLIDRGVSPEFVLTMTEEPARRTFQDGRAVFMRNWPYAWSLMQSEGSAVRGKIGMTVIPGSAATLGGWHLGVNRYSRHPDAAERFVRFMTSRAAEKRMTMTGEFHPALRSLFADPELLAKYPFLASLVPIFESARPRPVTPYYMMISQVLQVEISAILAGLRTPEAALASAQEQIEHILEIEPARP